MKIDRIAYSESIEVSSIPGKWVKVGIEAEVLPDEHASDCMDAARSFIKTWLLNSEPPATNPNWDHNTLSSKELPVIDRSIERLEILIDDCKTIEELQKLYLTNGKICVNSSLQEHYISKIKELSK